MTIEKKKIIKSIDSKIRNHEKKIRELSEAKNLLLQKTGIEKTV
ncbi:unnamed protein product, partial [marine sediment metagenome]